MTAVSTSEDAATRLSTQPAPVGPRRTGQRLAPVRRAWRQLTSMRTALQLLFLLALAAIPGSFLPQRTINPIKVRDYLTTHPHLGPLLDRLSFFDVFASPWFAAVYLLLFVSLVGCLGPRIRLHARALRTPPPAAPARLSRLPFAADWQTAATAEDVLQAAREHLRGNRWRVVRREGTAALSAEKGYLRETGNLVFHVSLVLLLVGVALGWLYGFKGTVLVKQGDSFANTVFAFDDIKPGRRFSAQDLVPLHFTLAGFRAAYQPDGHAKSFDADVRWAAGPDAPLHSYDIRVNHPLHVGGAKVYLLGHGYAPHVVVRDGAGQVALDQAVPCLPQDNNFVSSCVIKAPDARPAQLAFEGDFTPDTAQDPVTGQVTSIFPDALNPALTVVGWRGDLRLDSGLPKSVYQLDKAGLVPADQAAHELAVGQTWRMPGGGSITLVGVEQWATFQVTQDPGKNVALLAGTGMVLGLLLSLFVRRRRLWVRVRPADPAPDPENAPRTVVELGGLARTDPEAFAAEFEALAAGLRVACPEPAPKE